MESCFTAKKLKKKKRERKEKERKEGKKETMRNASPYQCIMEYKGIKVPWNTGLFVYMKLSDTTWEESDIPVIVHKARFQLQWHSESATTFLPTRFCILKRKFFLNASKSNFNLHYFTLKGNYKLSQKLLLWEFG